MEILTILSAFVIVYFMAELYKEGSESRRAQAVLALIFSVCMLVITVMNHFIYITVLNQIYRNGIMPSWLLLDGWPSLTKGLECVSWGLFLGLSMLYASWVLKNWKNKVLTWTMRIGGILTLAGLSGPITGNMNFYWFSTIGYSLGFLLISIEIILFFNKNKAL
jgi:peptidoglycan/LPS O-acetylase OafA/YrhL